MSSRTHSESVLATEEAPSKRSRTDNGPAYTDTVDDSAAAAQSPPPASASPVSVDSLSTTAPLASSPPAPVRTCLLVIDVQNDFCTGSLKAPDALSIIPVINKLRVKYDWDLVVFTADAHPTDHVSFYINHAKDPKATLYQPYRLPSGATQVMWPVHCVKDTWGWAFHNDLIKDPEHDVIVEKGTEVDQEFYSAFICTDGVHHTTLAETLRANGITHVATCGLVYEYCVGNSALDSAESGFQTCILTDATRGLTNEAMKLMSTKLEKAGVDIITSDQMVENGFSRVRKSVPRTLSQQQQQQRLSQPANQQALRTSPQAQRQFADALLHRGPSLTNEPNLPRSLSSLVAAGSPVLSPLSAPPASSAPPLSLADRRPRVLVGFSGSVATIKAAELLTLLCAWAEVRVICTARSCHFFDVEAIRQQFAVTVYQDDDEWGQPWKRGDSVLHVELRRWADLMVIAPLSANTLAKIANGLCDNLLTTVVRCWSLGSSPLLLAPAMNTVMWESPFTGQQLRLLASLGVQILQPIEKVLACGDIGTGAMTSVATIDEAAQAAWTKLASAHTAPPQQAQQLATPAV